MELILTQSMQEAAFQCRQKETTFGGLGFLAMHVCRTAIFPSAEEKTPLPYGELCPHRLPQAVLGAPAAVGLISEEKAKQRQHRRVPQPAASSQLWAYPCYGLASPLLIPCAAEFTCRLQWVLAPLMCAGEVGLGGYKRSAVINEAPVKVSAQVELQQPSLAGWRSSGKWSLCLPVIAVFQLSYPSLKPDFLR